jgi:hypothetical protein
MDRQLRDLLEAAVGEPPHLVTLEAVHRRVARRRVIDFMAAATMALLLAGLGVVVATWVTGPGLANSHGLRAGVPRYYVQQQHLIALYTLPPVTVVRATATGAVTATVHCPWPRAQVASGIAAAGHQTFFIVCQRGVWGMETVVTGSRIYQFRITDSGRIGGYSLVRGGIFNGLDASHIAASSDGSEVAVVTTLDTPANSLAEGIMVINTRTGARAVWHDSADVAGSFRPFGTLSLTGDGRELVFTATPCFSHCRFGVMELRAVSPAARGGRLDNSRVLLRLPSPHRAYMTGAVISPDGATLTVVFVNTPGPGPGRESVSVVQFSTGRRIRVLYQAPTGNGIYYGFFSSDPSRRYLLLNVGPTIGPVNGWIDQGRLVRLTPANGTNVLYEAW